MPLLTKII